MRAKRKPTRKAKSPRRIRTAPRPAGDAAADPVLALARQLEALGVDVGSLLSEALVAENAVREFEREKGPLDVERFEQAGPDSARLTPFAHTARLLVAELEGEARAVKVVNAARLLVPESDLSAFEAKHGKRPLFARMTRREDLDVLPTIIRNVPLALDCRRVRAALQWLRAARSSRVEKDVPKELKLLLLSIGDALAKPARIEKPWRPDSKDVMVMNLWKEVTNRGVASLVGREERDARAKALDLTDWETLCRRVRYLKELAKQG